MVFDVDAFWRNGFEADAIATSNTKKAACSAAFSTYDED